MKKSERIIGIIAATVIAVCAMAALAIGAMLTKDRSTPVRTGATVNLGVAAETKIYAGGMVAVNASGYAVPAAASITNAVVGRAEEQVDNSSGANGAKKINIGTGVYRYANQAGAGNAASADDIGKIAYVVDDQTVSLNDSSGTRPPAGKIVDVDSSGVWVDFSANRYPTGTVTTNDLKDLAVTSSKILNGNISREHLDSGIAPSHITSVCNTTTAENDSDASVTETHSSIAGTDILIAFAYNGTGILGITNAVPGSGSAVFSLDKNGGPGTKIIYCAHKLAQ